ncbi:MAG: isoprenyl transferase [Rhodospirillales bacterium]
MLEPSLQTTGPFQPPQHVAIIMDGNGRWAKQRGLPRTAGHRQGAEAVRRVLRAAVDVGISYLTLYSFSSENWSRPLDEVRDLMGLLKLYLRSEISELNANGIRIRVIGQRDRLSPDINDLIDQAERTTAGNVRMTLILALSYGGRQEITQAVRKIAEAVQAGDLKPEDITPEKIAAHLESHDIPDPDLVIRTSGEQRLSNFLPWQTAYSELVFTDRLWPDFAREDLEAAVAEFSRRERRFGMTGPA